MHVDVARRPPAALLALTEGLRTLVDMGTLPMATALIGRAPVGDGHPVLVLPGLGGDDASTALLRRELAILGHDVHDWGLGRNIGLGAVGPDAGLLVARILHLHQRAGRTVSLVGWSLGGAMARLAAQIAPEAVRQVITLGSPIRGGVEATNGGALYALLSGERADTPEAKALVDRVAAPLPVPTTCIYTRGDGVVAWQNCRDETSARCENVEVRGSHCGLGFNAAAIHVVADRLAQPEGGWRPFSPPPAADCFFPRAS